MPIVTFQRPQLVDEDAGKYRRPCSGTYLARQFDSLNWAALIKGRPSFIHTIPWEEDVTAVSPVGMNWAIRCSWRATKACAAIYLRVIYQATRRVSNASDRLQLDAGTYIQATLLDEALVAVDEVPAIEWSFEDGTLPIPQAPRADGFAIGHVDTGVTIVPAPGAGPTAPRPINAIGVGEQDITLEVAMRNARVLAVWALELPSEIV